MNTRRLVILFLAVFVPLGCLAEAKQQLDIATAVVRAPAAATQTFEWGRLMTYYSGETRSSRDTLVAVAIVNPGMQIHPPHVHPEEEYLMVLEGAGTWTVKGEQFPARGGDVLYAAPWDEHGIANTGATPMRFVFLKWNGKPVEPMEKPGN